VLLGTPELHHWHHHATARVSNFANLAPWTDLLFGTYHLPKGEENWPLGLTEPFPKSYLGMLLTPFVTGAPASGAGGIDAPREASPALSLPMSGATKPGPRR
jgi:sterol desaturase/sphingolipid hydroxylase (fatty acid hydroxylase superfamily)